MNSWLTNWLERHRHPASIVLHVLGIPLIPAAGVVAALQLMDGAWSLWWRPVLLLVISYVLQWIGHLIEGNDMGEVILIKKLLGRPYVAVAPRYARESTQSPSARLGDYATCNKPTSSP